MTTIDDLARQILADVVADFMDKNLGSDALNREYVGASVVALEIKHCTDGSHSKIDFDPRSEAARRKQVRKDRPNGAV